MSKIIISYHTEQNQTLVNRLVGRLNATFGDYQVIRGIRKIAGRDDPSHEAMIEDAVIHAEALLVVIDEEWLLGDWFNDAEDPDYIAISTALYRGIRVIPILIERAELPTTSQLPTAFMRMARMIPMVLTEARFEDNSRKIIDTLKPLVPMDTSYVPPKPEPDPTKAQVEYQNRPKPVQVVRPGGGTPVNSNTPLFIRAFRLPFTDQQWFPKIAIVALLNLIPLVGPILLTGYGLRVAARVVQGAQGLPELDEFGSDLTYGFAASLGILIQTLVFFIPVFLLMSIIGGIGAERIYSEELGRFVVQPNALSTLVSLIIFLGAFYVFGVIIATSLANFVTERRLAVFFEFQRLLREVTGNVGRNFILIGNFTVFIIIGVISALFGFNLLLLPGFFALAVVNIGQYYFIAHWIRELNGSEQTPKEGKPKNDYSLS